MFTSFEGLLFNARIILRCYVLVKRILLKYFSLFAVFVIEIHFASTTGNNEAAPNAMLFHAQMYSFVVTGE